MGRGLLILMLMLPQLQSCKLPSEGNARWCSEAGTDKEWKMDHKFNPRVVEWVGEAPFDNPVAQQQRPNFSYDEWFQRGRLLPYAVETLVKLLEQEDVERPSGNGMRVAYALGWVGDKRREVLDGLAKATKSRDVNLRMEAVSALGRQGDESVVPTIEKLLQNKRENVSVRGSAYVALGRLKVSSSEKLLMEALSDSDPFIVSCAKEGLRLFRE
jgi:HEAT repeats